MRKVLVTFLWFPVGQILFGLWLFERLPAKPPQWLTSQSAADPAIAYPELARVIFLSLLILISVGPFIWIDTARLRKRFSLADVPAMLRLVLRSKRGALTFGVLVLFLAQTAWFVFRGVLPSDSYMVRIPVAIACGILMHFLLPPAAIVLASSSGDSAALLKSTSVSFFPLRVVSLLNGAHLGGSAFASEHDNLRTISGQTWRESVHRLVDITQLVIVDARSTTPPVCEEIRYMRDPSRITKALFIVNDDGSAPGLDEPCSGSAEPVPYSSRAADVPRAVVEFKRAGAITQQRF